MVQWLGLHASTAGGTGLMPGQGTKILQVTWQGQKKKKKKRAGNKFMKIFILKIRQSETGHELEIIQSGC